MYSLIIELSKCSQFGYIMFMNDIKFLVCSFLKKKLKYADVHVPKGVSQVLNTMINADVHVPLI